MMRSTSHVGVDGVHSVGRVMMAAIIIIMIGVMTSATVNIENVFDESYKVFRVQHSLYAIKCALEGIMG